MVFLDLESSHLEGERPPRMHTRRCLHFGFRASIAGVALTFLVALARGEQTPHYRIFRASEGLRDSHVSAVTASPRGNVWVNHWHINANVSEISVFDGYSIRSLPSPGTNSYRVYESAAGQLWSVYQDGLLLHDRNTWVHHQVSEIRADITNNVMRQVRQIPLIPIQQDRVLFLLSDRLMEYDAARKQVTLIKRVSDTNLETFIEMTEARGNSGVWITGARGLGKLSGLTRSLNANSPWHEQLAGDTLQAKELQRPFEDSHGGITTVAQDLSVLTNRFILRLDGSTWRRHHAPPGENLRQAWPGWDQTTWSYTRDSLLQFDNDRQMAVSKERTWVGQYRDVAVETNGVFWLATSEGLVRYAPFCWRTPREIEEVETLVHAMLEDREGRLWFGTADYLVEFRNGQWKKIRWPSGFEAEFRSTDSLFQLPNGRIVIAARDRPLLYDPATGQFKYIGHQRGRRINFIGQTKSGKLAAQTSESDFSEAYILEQFDGQVFTEVIESKPDWNLGGELFFLTVAENGDVWLGGARGLGVVRNDQLQVFDEEQGFVQERIYCLLDLGNGKIWCGGSDKIQEYNGKSWSIVRSGLDRVNRMTKGNDGKIWVATARGLYSFADGSWVINGVEEGLPAAALSQILPDSQGRLWAATTRGISLYHRDADLAPPKTLTPVIANAERLMAEDPVTIAFNAVDKWHYTPVNRLLYCYRLDEGQWSPYASATTKVFESLRPGKHRFEVKAMDRNWNADPSFAFVEFTILVPWYQESRVIAVLVCGLILVLFFAGLAVNRHVQLTRSYAAVERIVAQRTRELEQANQELLHSQKMKALGTLAAGIAHDFNNILSIIKGSAQIIESNVEDKDKIRTRVSRIKTVVEQGAEIVKSMLGLSRVTEQDLVLCDINSVVDETIKLLGDRFLQEVTIQVEAAPGLAPILGLKELIHQMLLNLILNAADAMSGLGEICIKTGMINTLAENLALSPAEARTYVYIAVQDSGCGIAPEVLPRIFEPFFTTKALSTRRGTGLGLSMVYELAKSMGYGLKVRSAVGKGSTFSIIIPARSSMDDDALS
ncbi:MAG: hypothetical protein FJ403_01190 [Verrucomicrobia bacterium]|nr:hypothetical protein [Verrucomicrobiota bacterium]